MTDDKLYKSLSANTYTIMAEQFQRTRHTTSLPDKHLTLKMASAQVVETSVTNNSSFQNYPHPDDHTIRTTNFFFDDIPAAVVVFVCSLLQPPRKWHSKYLHKMDRLKEWLIINAKYRNCVTGSENKVKPTAIDWFSSNAPGASSLGLETGLVLGKETTATIDRDCVRVMATNKIARCNFRMPDSQWVKAGNLQLSQSILYYQGRQRCLDTST